MKKLYVIIICTAILLICNSTVLPQVAPNDPAAVPVEFQFVKEVKPPDVGIGINGSMNDWTNGVFKMHEVQPKHWAGVLHLLPKTYEYKFVTYTDTVGQSGVSAYFTDPLNPYFGGPFNNSTMSVSDPMVYYFLPKDGAVFIETKPVFSAKFAVANSSTLDAQKTEFYIDDRQIPDAASYYNVSTKTFTYTPAEPLSYSKHTARIKVYNTKGDTSSLTTSFTIASDISIGSYTFQFDSRSPNFNFLSPITKVGVKGTFNFEGLDEMSDTDGDGIYTVTKSLTVDKPEEYTIIVNGGSYINDPDNPLLSKRHRTEVVKKVIPRAYFTGFTPFSGTSYAYPLSELVITNIAVPGDSGYALESSSAFARLDSKIYSVTKKVMGDSLEVTATLKNPSIGRHVIDFYAKDNHGFSAITSGLVFGVYNPNTGFHYVDSENDDMGTGNYTYPGGISSGSADIREFHVTASAGLDSLIFSIKMEKITDNTCIGFSVVNKLDGTYTEAPDVELRIPEWKGRGVFGVIKKPTALFDPSKENMLFVSADAAGAIKIQPDPAAMTSGEFRFSVSLKDLQDIMGTYKDKWYYGFYSYLKNSVGYYEVGTSENGEAYTEDTDVYDAGFFSDPQTQQRLLSNFIPADGNGGPRIATIGSEGRGYLGIAPSEIHHDLGTQPLVKIYAGGGDLLAGTVRITGFADVPAGTDVNVDVNGTGYVLKTNSSKEFSGTVTLKEGENRITAGVMYGTSGSSISTPVIYNYIVDHKPVAKITASVLLGQNTVTLSADSSYDPDGSALQYYWSQDRSNPAPVSMNTSGPAVSFELPQTKGEYYFRLKLTDAAGDTAWARAVVVRNDHGISLPDMTQWHPQWQDSLIVYSVFVRTFDASGKFKGITERMNELAGLGINCIWFLPIHPTTGNLGPDNPGYAITDYMDVLDNYGTRTDLKALVKEAHKYGIRVILDHVIQHTSDLHPFMKDANKYKNNSPYYPFYMWDANNNFQYMFTWVDLPSINYEEPATRDYLIRMAKYWVQEFDIDGYRCDVAHVINNPSLRPSGPAYWQRWRRELKAIKPDIFLLAECDATTTSIFDKKFDAAYDWAWFGRIKNVVTGTGTIDDLNGIIDYYNSPEFPANALTFKFLENQDEQRFIDAYGLGNTKVSAAHLMTAPGIPQLYAGQEVGEETNRGNIEWSDPNGLKPYYKKLVEIRRTNPALSKGDFIRIENTAPSQIYSYLRTYGSSSVITALNFSQSAREAYIKVPVEKMQADTNTSCYLNDLLNSRSYRIRVGDLKNYYVNIPSSGAQIFILSDTAFTAVEDLPGSDLPLSYELMQNYPNPFNPSTTIKYSLPYSARVNISIFNILGQRVAELVNREENAGYHEAYWSAFNLASGIYIYRIDARSAKGSYTSSRKMLLLK